MELVRINDGIADRVTAFKLINRNADTIQNTALDWIPNPNYMELKEGQFFEIEVETYWYFLEVLPPLYMSGGAFAMREFKIGDFTDAFFEIGGRYFCATVRISADADEMDQASDAARSLRLARAGIAADMARRAFA